MLDQTYRTAFYPLNETGIDLTFLEVEYKIIERDGNIIRASFVNLHHNVDEFDTMYYEFPSLFTIDTSREVILTEDGKAFAKTTIFRERN